MVTGLVLIEKRTGNRFPLRKFPVLIGRSKRCDVVLGDLTVSRRHARIDHTKEGLFLIDLNSRNGTKVRGVQIGRVQIFERDNIRIGGVELLLHKESRRRLEKVEGEPKQPSRPRAKAKPPRQKDGEIGKVAICLACEEGCPPGYQFIASGSVCPRGKF